MGSPSYVLYIAKAGLRNSLIGSNVNWLQRMPILDEDLTFVDLALVTLVDLYCRTHDFVPLNVSVGYQYFFSKNVHRSIVYGDQPRNR